MLLAVYHYGLLDSSFFDENSFFLLYIVRRRKMNYDYEELKSKLSSDVLCDVLDGLGYRNQSLGNQLHTILDETVIMGPAFTSIANEVYAMPENPLIAQCKVVDQVKEGDIYVLATRGQYNCAVFGELFATAVAAKKCGGVLLDGFARDIKQLKAMKAPLIYRGINPKTSKGRAEINECQLPVMIDGVTICPGDIIFGDIDGVVVIPQDIADKVFEEALETVRKEGLVREGLKAGDSLEKVYTEIGAI